MKAQIEKKDVDYFLSNLGVTIERKVSVHFNMEIAP